MITDWNEIVYLEKISELKSKISSMEQELIKYKQELTILESIKEGKTYDNKE